MKIKKSFPAMLLAVITALTFSCNQPPPVTESPKAETVADPLPSWNEGATKQAIIDFVKNSTDSTGKGFIPVADRIACFDNDGTLWTEMPMPFQLFFVFDQIKVLAPQHPEWKDQQPFKGVLEGDLKSALSGGEKALAELIMATHSGMTTDTFDKTVKDWMATATHPKTGKHYYEMVYQPMLELLNYLRANGYKTFIVSGGGIDFLRVWSEEVYGIPPYQVVGSSTRVKYDTSGTQPVLIKLPELNFFDDKLGKPVGIHQHIGKRPVFTAGNSDGDYGMLQYTSTGSGPHFGLIIHHTDSLREYAYDRLSRLARLSKGLDDAAKYHWEVVDMQTDWNKVYPEGQPQESSPKN
jgi:phosphoglycolate phosphatase-like HAD superfamily hydrolase